MSKLGKKILKQTDNNNIKQFVEAMEELVSEGKLTSYSLVYTNLEKAANKGNVEEYLNSSGDFLSSLRDSDYRNAILRADMRNGAALARADTKKYLNVLADEFGMDSLEENVEIRLPTSMEKEIKEEIDNLNR